MNYFVYYHDDWEAHGLEKFSTEAEAIKFIEHRMKDIGATLESYKLIHGQEVQLEAVEVAIKIKRKA